MRCVALLGLLSTPLLLACADEPSGTAATSPAATDRPPTPPPAPPEPPQPPPLSPSAASERPEGFPPDFPLPAGGTLVDAQSRPNANRPTWVYSYRGQTREALEAFVREAMANEAWRTTDTKTVRERWSTEWHHGAQHGVVRIGATPDGAFLFVAVSEGATPPESPDASPPPGWFSISLPPGGVYDPRVEQPFTDMPSFLYHYEPTEERPLRDVFVFHQRALLATGEAWAQREHSSGRVDGRRSHTTYLIERAPMGRREPRRIALISVEAEAAGMDLLVQVTGHGH